MRIDLLVGKNDYGTTLHFAKGLEAAFRRLEVHTRLFEVGEGEFYHAFHSIMENPPDLTCSFSDLTVGTKSLGDFLHIPHLSLLVDPPIYFLHQLQGPFAWASCVDEKDCAFVRALGCEQVFCLPHGVDATLKTAPGGSRPYEAVFFGTCIDYDALASQWPAESRDLLTAACERVLSPEGISIVEALVELGVESETLPRYHHLVDQYIRGRDRVEMIRGFQKKVHLWGEGPWAKYLPEHPIHASLPFDQTLEVLRQSQVVLNSSPRFKAGGHERILYALMCGAGVYSGSNAYLEQHLPEVQGYDYGVWEYAPRGSWQEIAAIGQARVLKDHTWDARANNLLCYLF